MHLKFNVKIEGGQKDATHEQDVLPQRFQDRLQFL